MIKNVKPIYEQLSNRDRRAGKLLGCFLAFVTFFYVILQPSYHYYVDGREQLSEKHELLEWILVNGKIAAMKAASNQPTSSSTSLIEIVSDAALNLTLDRVQPEGEQLRVWINQANFVDLMKWLVLLDERHGIGVSQISIDRSEKPGIVKVYVLFVAPPL